MLLISVTAAMCLISLALILAGARYLERKAARWESWEQWMRPPDDDDGVSILEEEDPDGQNTR